MWRRIIVVFVFHNWIATYHQVLIQSILNTNVRHRMIKTKVKIRIEFLLKIKTDDVIVFANNVLHYLLSIFVNHVHFASEKIYSRERSLSLYLCLWSDLSKSRRFHLNSHHDVNNNNRSEERMFHDFDNLKWIFVAWISN